MLIPDETDLCTIFKVFVCFYFFFLLFLFLENAAVGSHETTDKSGFPSTLKTIGKQQSTFKLNLIIQHYGRITVSMSYAPLQHMENSSCYSEKNPLEGNISLKLNITHNYILNITTPYIWV